MTRSARCRGGCQGRPSRGSSRGDRVTLRIGRLLGLDGRDRIPLRVGLDFGFEGIAHCCLLTKLAKPGPSIKRAWICNTYSVTNVNAASALQKAYERQRVEP